MTCRHCHTLLSPHLDGVLSHQEEQTILVHLAQCADCAKYLSQLEQNRQLIQTLPVVEVTAKMQAQLQSRVQSPESRVRSPHSVLSTRYSLLVSQWREWPMLSFGTVATCAASLFFYFAMMQAPPKVSAEEVVASMDQLIDTLDPDEGERVITEETPDEMMPDWSDEIDRELFENENEQN